MFKTVKYIAQYEAEEMIPTNTEIMISITSGWPVDLDKRWNPENVIVLAFDDIELEEAKYKIQQRLFESWQATQIIEFVNSFENNPDIEDIVVHCFAGASRSAAVAKFLARKYKLEFDHEYKFHNKHVYETLERIYF